MDLTGVGYDLRYAIRGMKSQRAYTAATVLSLAVAIGATTTVLSAIDAVLFRKLPYAEPEHLVQVFARFKPRANMDTMPVAPANYIDWQAERNAFTALGAFRLGNLNVIGHDLPERIRAAQVTPNVFDILGTRAALGRTLHADDGREAAAPVAVISDALWQRRFNRDPAIVGRQLTTSSNVFSIVGVMPPSFRFPIGWMGANNVDVWSPLVLSAQERNDRRSTTLNVLARLAPGVSAQSAQASMDAIAARLEQEHPDTNRDWSTTVMALSERGISNMRSLLWLLLAGVAGLVLIACANVTNLLLARGLDRQREFAMRAAMGASRGRLLWQSITETVMMAALSGTLGIILAWWGTKALASIAPVTMVPELGEMRVSVAVTLTAVAIALLAGALVSVVPALLASHIPLRGTLQDGGRHGDTRERQRLKMYLAAGEIALTLVLLAAALSVTRTFTRYMSIDPGFDPQRLFITRVSLPLEKYAKSDAWTAFFRSLQEQADAIPGVARTALTTSAPMENAGEVTRYRVVGQPVPDATAAGPMGANLIRVSSDFLQTAGIRLRHGRTLAPSDTLGAERVAVVNEAFVRRALSTDAIGAQIVLQGDMNRTATRTDSSAPLTIVGVVADVKEYGLHLMTPPTIYVPLAQDPQRTVSLVVRSAQDQAIGVPALRALLHRLDPDLAPLSVRSVDEIMTTSHAFFTFTTVLIGLFAAMAVMLALAGLFSVIAYTTARRGHEWAVRRALGAPQARILTSVLRRAIVITAAGCVVGLTVTPAALAFLARIIKSSMNVDLIPAQFVVVGQCVAAMVVVAVMAAALPAYRAASAEPLRALRSE